LQLVVDVAGEALLQLREVHLTSAHDVRSVGIVDERQQQVFERGVLVLTLVGISHRPVERLFEITRELWQSGPLNPFPWCTGADAGDGAPSRSPGRPWSRPPHR